MEIKNARKTSIVGIPMTEEMREQLESLAKAKRWSRAEAARYMIEQGLATREPGTEAAA